MPPLPVVSGLEAIQAFERAGWRRARQKGSHVSLVKPAVNVNLSIPLHRELDRGTLRKLKLVAKSFTKRNSSLRGAADPKIVGALTTNLFCAFGIAK
jgi:predicted RNA binding protein YcfA (HicA-like mRNA interferase family)